MKKILFIGLTVISAVALVSCKSTESSYKKAYEKAQQEAELQAQQQAQQAVNTATNQFEETVAPVTDNYPANDDPSVRSERLQGVNGELRAFNVVCGSYKMLENAQNQCSNLKNRGYSAIIAQNPETGMYRVIAQSSDSKSTAISVRDEIRRSIQPDAWLLYNNR